MGGSRLVEILASWQRWQPKIRDLIYFPKTLVLAEYIEDIKAVNLSIPR